MLVFAVSNRIARHTGRQFTIWPKQSITKHINQPPSLDVLISLSYCISPSQYHILFHLHIFHACFYMTHWQSTKQMVASVFGSQVLKLKLQSSLSDPGIFVSSWEDSRLETGGRKNMSATGLRPGFESFRYWKENGPMLWWWVASESVTWGS